MDKFNPSANLETGTAITNVKVAARGFYKRPFGRKIKKTLFLLNHFILNQVYIYNNNEKTKTLLQGEFPIYTRLRTVIRCTNASVCNI